MIDHIIDMQYLWIIIFFGIALVCFIYFSFRIFFFKKKGFEKEIESISYNKIKDFVIEDFEGGEILIDYLFLTSKGFLIIEIKDIKGNVFGGNNLHDWTVLTENRRYTFSNPQAALRERIMAVQQIVNQVPVYGRLLFPKEALFTKGVPDLVTNLNDLISDFQESNENIANFKIKSFMPYWDLVAKKAILNK